MEFLQRYWQQARQVWLGMSLGRRVLFSVVAALSVAAVVGVGYWASQPDYRVLYSELSAEDAGAITAKLQTQGVSFRLAANGTTIMVPAEQVQQLRLDLSVEGLPAKGGKGFELLDGNQIGTTPFGQHVNYTRALQTELARTIMQIEPVAFARIHLVQPEESPFIRERKPATASVVLKIKPGGHAEPQHRGRHCRHGRPQRRGADARSSDAAGHERPRPLGPERRRRGRRPVNAAGIQA